jgi:YidC/Oxa1 family membrane protein insertase
MDMKRVILCALLAMLSFYLWNNWQLEHPSPVAQNLASPSPMPTSITTDQVSSHPNSSYASEPGAAAVDSQTLASIKTDVFNITLDTQGNIVGTQLLQYPVSTEQPNTPFTLLERNNLQSYVANSNLFTFDDHAMRPLVISYRAEQANYQLAAHELQLTVTLSGQVQGLNIQKQYTFHRGSYLIDMQYSIANQANSSWQGYLNNELLRTSPQEDKSSMFHVGSFTGASYSNPGHQRYKKLSIKDMEKNKLDALVEGGWVAMQQHYFLTAWVPSPNSKNQFYTHTQGNDYAIGAVSQSIEIAPKQTSSIAARLYVGPEVTDTLKAIAPGLDLTVDYGWLWFLSNVLFSLLRNIHLFIGNWGWSIVLVTLLIKVAFYRLSATSYKSMANMRKVAPKLQALRERYGDDKAKISQATMELYRQEKVNPLGGCLPIVIQIPVFIALYWVLLESVELRQAPFIFWLKDLAAADPYHILPIIMGATMLIQQKLNPAPPDPTQAKVMMFLPVLFTGLFWSFPAGLVLYWIVNNTLSILQQWYITKKFGDTAKEKSSWVAVK